MNTNKFTLLKNWCIANGSYINDKISFNDQDNIFYTTETINSNEKIFEINQKCILSNDKILELPFINTENAELFDNHEKLVLVLVYNMFIKEESFFKEYIDMLPKFDSFKSHPIYVLKTMINNSFDFNEEIKTLLGSYLKTINDINEKINFLYEKITNINSIYKKIIDKDSLLYGFLIVKTKSLDNKTLVPVIDHIPYSDKSTTILETDNSLFIFKSLEEYQPNTIINFNYGKKSNLEFYFHYNFIPENNIHKLSINITNEKIKDLLKDKMQHLGINFNGINPDLLALCRIQSLSETELNKIYESKKIDVVYSFINLENELTALKLLLGVFSNCRKDIDKKVKISLLYKESDNVVLQNFSKIFLNLNDAINKSILTILFLWNNMLDSPIKYNIKLE